jgi:hypothetical protein
MYEISKCNLELRKNELMKYLETLQDDYNGICDIIEQLNQLKLDNTNINEKNKPIKLMVYMTKEEINKQKTPEQIEVEKNSPLFKRNNNNYKYHNSQLGKKEGKTKFINETLNTDLFKQSEKNNKDKNKDNSEKSDKQNSNDKVQKIKIKNPLNDVEKNKKLLQNKKLNDLKIIARDLNIKGYSKMKKDELINYILEFLNKSNKQTSETKIENKKDNENKSKDKIEDIKNQDEQDYVENEDQEYDESLDDDVSYESENESEIDYC